MKHHHVRLAREETCQMGRMLFSPGRCVSPWRRSMSDRGHGWHDPAHSFVAVRVIDAPCCWSAGKVLKEALLLPRTADDAADAARRTRLSRSPVRRHRNCSRSIRSA